MSSSQLPKNKLNWLSKQVIIIYMIAAFLGFGVFSNFIDHEGLLYNLGQGIFISIFVGGFLYLARRISLRFSPSVKKNNSV